MTHALPGSTVLVVAPHPDDETLGCGGTLLQHAGRGDAVHWVIVTAVEPQGGCDRVERVAEAYGFTGVHRLDMPDARLDEVPLTDLVGAVGEIVEATRPEVVYLPHPGDAHSDHRVAFEAGAACTKSFRFPSVRRVLAYETPSETDFGLRPDVLAFRPNVFVDITDDLDRKLEILELYDGEIGAHPFPRSAQAVRALATLRGAAAGCLAAEGFVLLREIRSRAS